MAVAHSSADINSGQWAHLLIEIHFSMYWITKRDEHLRFETKRRSKAGDWGGLGHGLEMGCVCSS